MYFLFIPAGLAIVVIGFVQIVSELRGASKTNL